MVDVNITHETLAEIFRREKNRDELQALSPRFFEDVVQYLKEKQQLVQSKSSQLDEFSIQETKKTIVQLENIRNILKHLHELREKKLISMALNKSRTGSSLANTSAMLKEEKLFFEETTMLFDKFRNTVLMSVLSLKNPSFVQEEKPKIEEKPKKPTKLIRFLHAVPKFVGEEMEIYGPFEEEDVASLPVKIADVLIEKARAEEMEI